MTVQADLDDYQRFRAWAAQAERKIAAAQRKRLRQIGNTLVRELLDEGSEGMPSSGGLRDRLASTKAGVQLLSSGVRLRLGAKGAGIGAIDRKGSVRHPTYGNRKAWASTEVEPGTWSKAFGEKADDVRSQMRDELQSVLKEAKSL